MCYENRGGRVPQKRNSRFTVLRELRYLQYTCTTIDTEASRPRKNILLLKNYNLALYGRFYRQNAYRQTFTARTITVPFLFFTVFSLKCIAGLT